MYIINIVKTINKTKQNEKKIYIYIYIYIYNKKKYLKIISMFLIK